MADMLVQTQMGYQSKLKCGVLSALVRFSDDDYKMLLMFVIPMLAYVLHWMQNSRFISKSTNVNTKVCIWLLIKSDVYISSCREWSVDK